MRRTLLAIAVVLAAGSCTADDDGVGPGPRIPSLEDVGAVADHIEAGLGDEVVVSDTSLLGLVIVSVVAEGNADATVRAVCLSALEVTSEVRPAVVVLAGDGSLVWESDGGNTDCPPG